MLFESVMHWYEQLIQTEQLSCKLVLHTSCVNYSVESLEKMKNLPMEIVLPNSVHWELRHLLDSSLYGKRARMILQLVGNVLDWDIEMLYTTEPAVYACEQSFDEILLFAFGDKGKQDEFLLHVREMPQHYVLVNTAWHVNQNWMDAYRVFRTGTASKNVQSNVPVTEEFPPLRSAVGIRVQDSNVVFNGAGLKPLDPYRNGMELYACDDVPGCYARIYQRTLTSSQKTRMDILHFFGKKYNFRASIPKEILLTKDHIPIGYLVKAFDGVSLQNMIDRGWPGYDPCVILRKLALLLLEMHSMHMLAGNLSASHILADKEGNIYLTDGEAIQVLDFPAQSKAGGDRHPEFTEDNIGFIVQEPRHEYYSFGVLAMQCLEGRYFPAAFECEKLYKEVCCTGVDRSIGAWLRALSAVR